MVSSAKITLEKSIVKPETDFVVPCSVKGYPPPEVNWYKMSPRGRTKSRLVHDADRFHIRTYQVSLTETRSELTIRRAEDGDSGNYRCEAVSPHFRPAEATAGIRVQWGPGERCVDKPAYHHCEQVVKHRFCGDPYYGQFCCRSCTNAGFLPGGLNWYLVVVTHNVCTKYLMYICLIHSNLVIMNYGRLGL